MAQCTECGKELTGRRTKVCATACRTQRLRKSDAYKRAKEKHRSSDKCRARRTPKPRSNKCVRCGNPARSDALYCSKGCVVEAKRKPKLPKKVKEKRESWPSCRVFLPVCQVCGESFATPYTVITCSPECREIKRRDDKRVGRDRYRARQKAAYVADVRRRDIYKRDGWCCQLCGEPVDRSVEVPHPMAPTIDHIVPLAVGGTHEPRNAQTAHFICNCTKRDVGKANDQLRLVG